LKHLQDDVREVRTGFECGVGVKGFDEFEEGDILENFIIELVPAA
jgi:translation initiation factor IF-2